MNDLATSDGLGPEPLPATPANIRRLWPEHGNNLFGVDASEGSFDEFSVNPGDYADFADCDDDERLFGENAVLCLRRPPFTVLTAEPENPRTCPNCDRSFADLTAAEHVDSGCVLGALVGVVRDRENVAVDQARIESMDVDGLWDLVGPVVDKVEATIEIDN